MGFRLVPKSMTLNGLERRNGHCQVTRAEMTQDQTLVSIRMNILVRPASADIYFYVWCRMTSYVQ